MQLNCLRQNEEYGANNKKEGRLVGQPSGCFNEKTKRPLRRPGDDLLSHGLSQSTISAEGFHGRVRDGNVWCTPRYNHQAV